MKNLIKNNKPLFINIIGGLIVAIILYFISKMGAMEPVSLPKKDSILSHFIFVSQYWKAFLWGMANTVFISFFSIFIGTLLAIYIAYKLTQEKKGYPIKVTQWILNQYIGLFLSIPALVLLVFIFSGSFGFNLNSTASAIAALSLNLSPFAARIIESGINNIEDEHIDTARSFGYDGKDILWKFKIPIIYKHSIEPLLVQWITTIKLSSLASVIGVGEILFQGNAVIAESYQTETIYITVIVCYGVIVYCFSKLIEYISKLQFKYSKP